MGARSPRQAPMRGGAGGWLATHSTRRTVAPAAETLAVLPFHASGPGVEFLGEGMMDLLATNLRGVGGINTVDPRVVLREWGSSSSASSDDLSHALAVGRDLHAGSVLLGSAVAPAAGYGWRPISTASTASSSAGPRWTVPPTACWGWWTGSVWRCFAMSGAPRSRFPISGLPRLRQTRCRPFARIWRVSGSIGGSTGTQRWWPTPGL